MLINSLNSSIVFNQNKPLKAGPEILPACSNRNNIVMNPTVELIWHSFVIVGGEPNRLIN
jgi:hypothetical protein